MHVFPIYRALGLPDAHRNRVLVADPGFFERGPTKLRIEIDPYFISDNLCILKFFLSIIMSPVSNTRLHCSVLASK